MFVYASTPEFVSDPFFTRGVSPGVVEKLGSPAYQKTVAADPHFGQYRGILRDRQA